MGRLERSEFADELVASCVARHLRIILTIVPYTPPSAAGQWCIAEYPSDLVRESRGIPETARIVLGNDDVHYVWLSPAA